MAKINKVLFIGSKMMGLKCLNRIHSLDQNSLIGILTLDDRKDTRSVFNDFKAFARKANVRLYVAKNRNDSERLIKELRPELCIVVGWYWLFSKETISVVSSGFLGIHNSLLPKYRGGSPLIWSTIEGDKKIGLSLFSLTEGLDDGGIWGQRVVHVEDKDYITDILEKLELEAVSLLEEKYPGVLNKTIKPVPQKHDKATFRPRRFVNDGLINWREASIRIYNFIRFQSEPYPGAFTYYRGHKLIIWRAHSLGMIFYGSPGQVARINEDGVYVICGDRKPIVLEVVQLGSSSKKPANKVIKSIGTRFPNF